MTTVRLKNQISNSFQILWEKTHIRQLIYTVAHLITKKSLDLCIDAATQPGLAVRKSIRGDERSHVRIDLTDDEGVDVEELAHPGQRKVAGNTSIDEFEVSPEFSHVVRLNLS